MDNCGLSVFLENFISHLNNTNEHLLKTCSTLAIKNEQLHSTEQLTKMKSDRNSIDENVFSRHLTMHSSFSQSLRNGRMAAIKAINMYVIMCTKYNNEQKQKYMDNLSVDSYTLLPYHTLEEKICDYKNEISATKEKERAVYQNSKAKYVDLQNQIKQLQVDINSLRTYKEEIRKQKIQLRFKIFELEHKQQYKLKKMEHLKSGIAAIGEKIALNENTAK